MSASLFPFLSLSFSLSHTNPTLSPPYSLSGNLDWNLEDVLKEFVITLQFQRKGQTLFTGTGSIM